jgi:hypothetical protein
MPERNYGNIQSNLFIDVEGFKKMVRENLETSEVNKAIKANCWMIALLNTYSLCCHVQHRENNILRVFDKLVKLTQPDDLDKSSLTFRVNQELISDDATDLKFYGGGDDLLFQWLKDEIGLELIYQSELPKENGDFLTNDVFLFGSHVKETTQEVTKTVGHLVPVIFNYGQGVIALSEPTSKGGKNEILFADIVKNEGLYKDSTVTYFDTNYQKLLFKIFHYANPKNSKRVKRKLYLELDGCCLARLS